VRPVAAASAALLAAAAPVRAQVSRITPELMARRIGVLADDSMRGRFTPSRELEQAAAYVRDAFRNDGLTPAGESGGFEQRFAVPGGSAPNVVAVLQGSDARLARDYVAVVAHMDHIGVTARAAGGDSIRNGADDNASGTSGLLALADAFAKLTPRPRRSVLFLVTSGEERGLLGAQYFVAHPTVPLENIVALVNLDMISRNRPDSVYLNGWGKSTLSDLVRRLAVEHAELGLSVGPDPEDRPMTPADSDHWPFQHQGVPYVFFYTGEHPDYHGVGDEPARVDADKAARVTRLAFYTVLSAANADERPRWMEDARRLNVPGTR
jgi:Zn-dependent M28 family amino/carboxypeptidase